MRLRHVLIIALFIGGFLLTAFASWQLWIGFRDDAAAEGEYTELRDQLSAQIFAEPAVSPSPGTPDETADILYTPPEADYRMDMRYFIERNPDFVGWISIAGTTISYPVVQGTDNAYYLYTTFTGQPNPAGSIFMDYRAETSFETPLAVLYGHNMRNGSMFAPLHQFLDTDFLTRYPEIIVINAEGETLVYHIFNVRWTDAWDDLYSIDFNSETAAALHFEGAPERANRFLVLSTCADSANRNARLLVYAARIGD